MPIEILGPQLFETGPQGELKSRVGTLFPRHRVLVTLPGIHACQRMAFLDHLNHARQRRGQPPLSPEEEEHETDQSVDLFFEPGRICIRPDPDNMPVAFAADEMLQELVSKRCIKFLFVFNRQVQQPIKERGECWRISALPFSHKDMHGYIAGSKTAIHERPIYYYSRASGTRYVTFQEFAQLETLSSADLARQLQEIADHTHYRNRLGNPEVAFFEAAPQSFNAKIVADIQFTAMAEPELRACHTRLKERLREAVPASFQTDDLRLEAWRNRMFTTLVNPADETVAEDILRGLSPEFFLQIEWLPGGRFEEGEFIFDSIFDEAAQHPEDEGLQRLCDPKAKGFIFNFIREYGDLEYVNVGHIVHSLSKREPGDGRRAVYIAELKPRSAAKPVVRFIRLLKWGVQEHLDEGKELLQAILESDDYVDFVLDRRLGCRQLSMNLPSRISIRRISEVYQGKQAEYHDYVIRTAYSERDYLQGFATDKLPSAKYKLEEYASRLARLLGTAAATNIIVGRTYDAGTKVLFDDGDEVVVENDEGLPEALIVGDHSGAFREYERPLTDFAADYARPVNSRVTSVPHPRQFAEAYLEAFRQRFGHLQGDYRKRRRAFDTLFKHCKYDPEGSFAFRWECVLKRLDQTDPVALIEAVRRHITVLPEKPPDANPAPASVAALIASATAGAMGS